MIGMIGAADRAGKGSAGVGGMFGAADGTGADRGVAPTDLRASVVSMAKKKRPVPVPPPPLPALFDAHTHLGATVPRATFPEDLGALLGAERSHTRPAAEATPAGTADKGEAPSGRIQDAEAVPVDLGAEVTQAYERELAALMGRAEAVGVRGVCTIGDGLDETELAVLAAHLHPRVWAACAVHPTRAHTLTPPVRERLAQLARDERCVAIGETGLDRYWIERDETTPSIDVQEEALRWHIDLAVATGKPLMIHNREADEDLLRILADAPQPPAVILHCFSSPFDVAKECLDRGYVLSFAGNVTFKANADLRRAAALAPADQLLVETDAPYMTPEPFRGARNEPAFVGYTARAVAFVREEEPEAFAERVTANAERLYGVSVGRGASGAAGAAGAAG